VAMQAGKIRGDGKKGIKTISTEKYFVIFMIK